MAYSTYELITVILLALIYFLVSILIVLILSQENIRNWIADFFVTGLLGLVKVKCYKMNKNVSNNSPVSTTSNSLNQTENKQKTVHIFTDIYDADVNLQVIYSESPFKNSLTFLVSLLICNFAFFFANIFFIDYTYSLECLSEKYYLCFSELCFDANSTQTNMNDSSEAGENLILCMRYHIPDSIISFTSKMTIIYAIFMIYVHMNRGFVKFMIKSKINKGLTWNFIDKCNDKLKNVIFKLIFALVFFLFIVFWNVFILFVNVEFVNIFKLITFLVLFLSNFALSIPFIICCDANKVEYALKFSEPDKSVEEF